MTCHQLTKWNFIYQHISYQKMKEIYSSIFLCESLVLLTVYLAFVRAADQGILRRRWHKTQRGFQAARWKYRGPSTSLNKKPLAAEKCFIKRLDLIWWKHVRYQNQNNSLLSDWFIRSSVLFFIYVYLWLLKDQWPTVYKWLSQLIIKHRIKDVIAITIVIKHSPLIPKITNLTYIQPRWVREVP